MEDFSENDMSSKQRVPTIQIQRPTSGRPYIASNVTPSKSTSLSRISPNVRRARSSIGFTSDNPFSFSQRSRSRASSNRTFSEKLRNSKESDSKSGSIRINYRVPKIAIINDKRRMSQATSVGMPEWSDEEQEESVFSINPMKSLKVEKSLTPYRQSRLGSSVSMQLPQRNHRRISIASGASTAYSLPLNATALKRWQKTVFQNNASESEFTSVSEEEANKEAKRLELRAKFQRAVRLVRVVCSLAIYIRCYADTGSARHHDWYYIRDMLPTTTPTQEQELEKIRQKIEKSKSQLTSFNKYEYTRENTLHFPLWARLICSKKPTDRTDDEIHKLFALLQGMKSFGRFTVSAQKNLCKAIMYGCFDKRRVILKQGQPGECFYFIISGTVSVNVTIKDSKTGISVTSMVDILRKDDAFGEIALMTKEAVRTATIISREKTELLLVEREVVLEICPDVFTKEHEQKLLILKEHKLFSDWVYENLRKLCFESHLKEVPYGQVIEKDTTNTVFVYFIISGKVKMIRRVNLKKLYSSRVTYELYNDMPLPRSPSALPGPNKPSEVLVEVGTLQAGDAWDLGTIKKQDQAFYPGCTLVSNGARLVRVPRRRILALAPKGCVEQFEQTYETTHRCYNDEKLFEEYLASQNWEDFKSKLTKFILNEKSRLSLSTVPITYKGSSGWAQWPGSRLKSAHQISKESKSLRRPKATHEEVYTLESQNKF